MLNIILIFYISGIFLFWGLYYTQYFTEHLCPTGFQELTRHLLTAIHLSQRPLAHIVIIGDCEIFQKQQMVFLVFFHSV